MIEFVTPAAGRDAAFTSKRSKLNRYGETLIALLVLVLVTVPDPALAQASPFSTGTTGFSTSLLAILTPLAVIGFMIIGGLAFFDIINWRWVTGAFCGVVLLFGAPQIVTWIRGIFAV